MTKLETLPLFTGYNHYSLFNLINHETDIDTIYLCAKDPYIAKYQLLINKRESTALISFNNSKAFN